MKLFAPLLILLSAGMIGCSSSECDSCGGNTDSSSLLNCPPTQILDLGDVVVNEGVVTKTLDISGVKLHNISCSCVVVTPTADKVKIEYRPFKGMGPDSQFTRLMREDGQCLGLIRLKARRVPQCEIIEVKPGNSWKLIVHTAKATGAPVLADPTAAKISKTGEHEWLLTSTVKRTAAPTYELDGSSVKVTLP